MSTKHHYKGWTITKFVGHYVAERDSDLHIAPFDFPKLKDAKEAIDNDEAEMTATEKYVKEYRQQIEAGMPLSLFEHRAYHLGDKAAEIVLEEIKNDSKRIKFNSEK